MTINEFFERLNTYEERIPLEDVTRELANLALSPKDLRESIRFGDAGYQRNPFRSGPGYEALVICWRPGQRSPVHDHRGATCGVRIVSGVATETLYSLDDDGRVRQGPTRELEEGMVCGSQDDDIHEMANLVEGRDLITLHIYSPHLYNMGVYTPGQPGRTIAK